ncbi:trypsin-1-like [Chrysoperla carnea]|uniref:trypsin-1-like n=1 Tax=Chrysoperla carnea TaxID=189513 RepID=UPI001D092B68|nr:trypsin-1-like [Chrysoperla carnea]
MKVVVYLTVVSVLVFSTNGNVLKPYLNGRIFGGKPAKIEEYPYQIQLETNSGSFICGGSIISPTVILTAAHCTNDQTVKSIIVRAGSAIRGKGGVVKTVKEKYVHEKYSVSDYDVSLLVLNEDLEFSSSIQSIPLPDESEYLKANKSAVTTGWGISDWGTGLLADNLQQVVEPIVEQEACDNVYLGGITPRMVCAGYLDLGGTGACFGDSGGPLVSNNKQHGIVSWGSGTCIQKGYPTVYTRVTAVREWIRSKVNI